MINSSLILFKVVIIHKKGIHENVIGVSKTQQTGFKKSYG